MDWKKKLINPNKRKQVWNNKEKRWLSHEEETELLRLLKEKQDKVRELTNGQDPQEFLKAEYDKEEAQKDNILKPNEDEPSSD